MSGEHDKGVVFLMNTFQIKCLIILQCCNHLPGEICFSLCKCCIQVWFNDVHSCQCITCKGWWRCVSVRASPVSFRRIMTGVSIVQVTVRPWCLSRHQQKLSSWHRTLALDGAACASPSMGWHFRGGGPTSCMCCQWARGSSIGSRHSLAKWLLHKKSCWCLRASHCLCGLMATFAHCTMRNLEVPGKLSF